MPFEVRKSRADAQYHTQGSSWKRVFVHIAIALTTIIFAALHIVQPDIDFTERTSIFLRPLSPLWIAVPLSVVYPLWLIGLVGNSTRRKIARLAQTCAGNGEIGLICLTLDALKLVVMLSKHLYSDLPNYEAGNYLVECEWLGSIFTVALAGAMLMIPIYFQWVPVMTIMGKWMKVLKSTYTGDLNANIGQSTAMGAWNERPSAIDIHGLAQLRPNGKETVTHNLVMLSDWEVLYTSSAEQGERERLKCFEDRLAALYATAADLRELTVLSTHYEKLIEFTHKFIRDMDLDLGSRRW